MSDAGDRESCCKVAGMMLALEGLLHYTGDGLSMRLTLGGGNEDVCRIVDDKWNV